jgi:hypothetical protein
MLPISDVVGLLDHEGNGQGDRVRRTSRRPISSRTPGSLTEVWANVLPMNPGDLSVTLRPGTQFCRNASVAVRSALSAAASTSIAGTITTAVICRNSI